MIFTGQPQEQHLPEPEYCTAVLWPGTQVSPPGYCDEEAADGEEYCERHLPLEHDDQYEDDHKVFAWGEDLTFDFGKEWE
jgi:hypothetical protein